MLFRSPKGGDTDQINGVASGECAIALANTYYVARMLGQTHPAALDVGGFKGAEAGVGHGSGPGDGGQGDTERRWYPLLMSPCRAARQPDSPTATTAMPALIPVAILGFDAAIRLALVASLGATARRPLAYKPVLGVDDARFVVVDADDPEGLALLQTLGRLGDAVRLSARPSEGADPARVLDVALVLQGLDANVCAGGSLIWEHDADFGHGSDVFWLGRAHHAGDVVGVGQGNGAFA